MGVPAQALDTQPDWAIETEELSKSFGHLLALRAVNLRVARHQCATIIGPNGAGKSTLIRILSTLLRPSSGRARLEGLDIQSQPTEVRRRVGFLAHQPLLYGDLSAAQNLQFYGRLYRVPDLEPRIAEVLTRVELLDRQKEAVRTLSRGMQQRLSIARAILHRPTILLLDEPHSGLDQRASHLLSDLLRSLLAEGCTLLMTTHDLGWAAGLSDQIHILFRGRMVYQTEGTLSSTELRDIYHQHAGGME